MKKVTGIGGVFFKCKDAQKTKEWYNKHLGMDAGDYGAVFKWRDVDDKEKINTTSWSTMKDTTKYFDPSESKFMINYRVENLEELLNLLKSEGVDQVGNMEVFDYGKFAWILDPEGNKIELWEPVDKKLL